MTTQSSLLERISDIGSLQLMQQPGGQLDMHGLTRLWFKMNATETVTIQGLTFPHPCLVSSLGVI